MMYLPKHYSEDKQGLIYEVIQKFSFATLVSATPEGPYISHLPVLLNDSNKTLLSHCARANPHWKHFTDGNPVTVIFNGPHAYVSPSWYEPDPENVPTWNYISVHVKGMARIIEDSNEAWVSMNRLVQHYENLYGTGWSLPTDSKDTLKNDLAHGITVFEISMDQVEAKFKLSQKQDLKNRNSVIENLPSTAGENGKLLAEYMKRVLK